MAKSKYVIEKFDEASRTFETRVKFIDELFSNTYAPEKIMASCVNYKLGSSFDNYIKDIHRSLWKLRDKDPIAILKRIDN